jgi:hypothetical protein
MTSPVVLDPRVWASGSGRLSMNSVIEAQPSATIRGMRSTVAARSLRPLRRPIHSYGKVPGSSIAWARHGSVAPGGMHARWTRLHVNTSLPCPKGRLRVFARRSIPDRPDSETIGGAGPRASIGLVSKRQTTQIQVVGQVPHTGRGKIQFVAPVSKLDGF